MLQFIIVLTKIRHEQNVFKVLALLFLNLSTYNSLTYSSLLVYMTRHNSYFTFTRLKKNNRYQRLFL